jgi:hypothetical protein
MPASSVADRCVDECWGCSGPRGALGRADGGPQRGRWLEHSPWPRSHSDARSVNSFPSSSFFGKLQKYELKRRFYEKLEDFKNKVLLHKESGYPTARAIAAAYFAFRRPP